MVTETRKDNLSAGIRKHIESLGCVIDDIENEQMGEETLSWRLRAVEQSLRRLREAA
ncbi:MAG: hypothetical protein WC859_03605 [Elusimicrobiota bacterium]|jgi:hypothetical protein